MQQLGKLVMRGASFAIGVGALVACSTSSLPSSETADDVAAIVDVPRDAIRRDAATACPAPFNDPSHPPAPGENNGFIAGGQTRRFQLLRPPPSFTGPRPILFAFHGTSETGRKFVIRAKLADFVARGFIVVAPDAVGNGSFWPIWDALRAPGTTTPNADIELFDRLLDCTAAHFPIDRNRIFATGHSAGGIFTNRLLRARSNVLAGGIIASGVFDLTSDDSAPLDKVLAVVTWGGDNDTYRGSTPSGVSVPAFSFVEQASLASKYYKSQPDVAHVRCRGNNLGHAWLPLNEWFINLLLARPKGSAPTIALPPVPAGAPAACSTDAYAVAPLPAMVCGNGERAGCRETCQLIADCAVENRTIGPTIATELSKIGFTTTSCAGCVQRCSAGSTGASDAAVLACFANVQESAECTGGIEGSSALFQAVNQCCWERSDSPFCVGLCTTLNQNEAAKPFFPVCQQIAP